MRIRRLFGVLTIAAASTVALGSLSACQPAKRVLVIGDSLTVGAVSAGLGDGHPWRWTVSAESGRGTNRGIAIARDRDIGAYDLVIVALGTNDYLDSKAAYATRIDNMMAALAPAALGVNPALAAAPARHPTLTVAGWNDHVRGVANMAAYRAGDEIHYNAAGYDLRARWMEALVT